MGNNYPSIRAGVLAVIAGLVGLTSACRASQKAGGSSSTLSSSHAVTLSWQATRGAKYYCVYRSTVSMTGYQKIGTSSTPTYKDAPVPAGATFYYVVTSVDNGGESKYSKEIKVVVPITS